MRFALLGLTAALVFGALAQAQAPAPAAAAAAPAYSSASKIGVLLDNPATRAVLMQFIPEVVTNPQIDQGRDMALLEIAQYVPQLTPEMYAKIDAELAKVPKA
jgi:para-nitrobenzyl esterase